MPKASNHVMLDLETMSTNSNAAIIAIGAVKFTVDGIKLDKFYANVSLSDCMLRGLHVDGNTVMWWMEQSLEAREALQQDKHTLFDALYEFNKWLGEGDDYKVWGNGATFDNVVIRSAYNAVGMNAPWGFRNDSCYRTLKNMFNVPYPDRKGTHHNALDDAFYQAAHCIEIFKHLGIK